MNLQTENEEKPFVCHVRLSQNMNDYIVKVSDQLKCNKSEAIRAMIRACKDNCKI